MPTVNIKDIPESKTVKLVDLSEDSINKIAEAVVRKIKKPEQWQMRLIDADALKKQGWRLCRTVHGVNTSAYETKDIEYAPTVDAVKVIWCKDCKYFEDENEYGNCYCSNFDSITYDYGFCHYAKRREDGKTDFVG